MKGPCLNVEETFKLEISSNNPFFEQDGKYFAKFDEVVISQGKEEIIVMLKYKGQKLIQYNSPLSALSNQSQINIIDMNCSIEVGFL